MKTTYTIYRHNGRSERGECDLATQPTYSKITALIEPILAAEFNQAGKVAARMGVAAAQFKVFPEHVRVIRSVDEPYRNGEEYLDMFVDETGHAKDLPRNEAATAIYRANWLRQHPGTDPESLPFIAGPAVLFDRRVWF